MRLKKIKHKYIQMVWDNVRFIPEEERVWYRGINDDIVYNSSIRNGNRTITVSLFTYGGDFKEGWDASVYDGGERIACRDIYEGNHIEAKDVGDAEKQALEWSETIKLKTL